MVNIKVVLDKRHQFKYEKYNLSIRLNHRKETIYVPIVKLTLKEYETVFEKNHLGQNSIALREKVNKTLSRCEKICADMVEFNGKRFKRLFHDDLYTVQDGNGDLPKTLELKLLFEYYIKHNHSIKTNTKKHLKTSINTLEAYDKGVTIYDITPKYLQKFERDKLASGSCNYQGLGSYLRDLKRIINYFTYEVKLIPQQYRYPFGKGGYTIKNVRKKKLVLSEEEILSIIELDEFETDYQRYARDIWLTLYYMNGINFVDLLRMKWSDVKPNHIAIYRKKTETTRKKVVQELNIPLIPPLKELINKVGNPLSPYVLGLLKENSSDVTITNRKNKLRQSINPELRKIGEKLKLSVSLTMMSARDCYASTLKRNGCSIDVIAEQLAHANISTTAHYVDSLGIEKSRSINEMLVMKKNAADNVA